MTLFVSAPLQESAAELLFEGVYQCLKDINVLTVLLLMRQHSATKATVLLDDKAPQSSFCHGLKSSLSLLLSISSLFFNSFLLYSHDEDHKQQKLLINEKGGVCVALN